MSNKKLMSLSKPIGLRSKERIYQNLSRPSNNFLRRPWERMETKKIRKPMKLKREINLKSLPRFFTMFKPLTSDCKVQIRLILEQWSAAWKKISGSRSEPRSLREALTAWSINSKACLGFSKQTLLNFSRWLTRSKTASTRYWKNSKSRIPGF